MAFIKVILQGEWNCLKMGNRSVDWASSELGLPTTKNSPTASNVTFRTIGAFLLILMAISGCASSSPEVAAALKERTLHEAIDQQRICDAHSSASYAWLRKGISCWRG